MKTISTRNRIKKKFSRVSSSILGRKKGTRLNNEFNGIKFEIFDVLKLF